MHTHENQAPGFQPQAGVRKPSPLGPRPFEVTFPGQELVAAPTNPFVQRSANSWATPPASLTLSPEGDTGRADVKLDWRPQFSLYAEGQPISPPPRHWNLQSKLTIGQPNDQYEQEADRVAEQVMSIPDRTAQQPIQRETAPEEDELQTKPLVASITPLVQREAMPEEEEVQTKPMVNTVQRQEMLEEEEAVQTKPSLQRATDGSLQADGNLESRLNSSKGGGSPLPQDVKGFMEARFRTDFSQVRVHTDSEAVQMNRDLNAQAFTHQQDVYFGAGKTPGKDALTAHELTHVVQQTDSIQQLCHDCEGKLQRVISTPLPSGAAPDRAGNASFHQGGFDVRILADGRKQSPGAETTINYNWGRISARSNRQGIVTSFSGPGNPRVTIQTLYGPGLSRTSTSGYGRGTTSADQTSGDTSLGFHEGSHGTDFLNFMSTVPVRPFLGQVGMSVADFRNELNDWRQGCELYQNILQTYTTKNTDCVGTTIDQYNATRGRITTLCPVPSTP